MRFFVLGRAAFLAAAAGLIGLSGAAHGQLVSGAGFNACDKSWHAVCDWHPYCFSEMPSIDKAVIMSEYHAVVDADYAGWELVQYDTWARAALIGIGTASTDLLHPCKDDTVLCTVVDLGVAEDEETTSLPLYGLTVEAYFNQMFDDPVLQFNGSTAWATWNLDGAKCDWHKFGEMYTRSVIGLYGEKAAVACCGEMTKYQHVVTEMASAYTVSKHTVTMNRCEEDATISLDVDLAVRMGICTDGDPTTIAGPAIPRFGWMGRVIYRVYMPGGVLQIESMDRAMCVGGSGGASARGGKFAGAGGAAMDSVLTWPTSTGNVTSGASGTVTLGSPTVEAYLASLPVGSTVDLEIEIEMKEFEQTYDADGDNQVTWADRAAHAALWGTTASDPGYRPELDWNADGVIDAADDAGFWPTYVDKSACLADVGSVGGVFGPDGVLDNNDFIVFIDRYMNQMPDADIGSAGGVPGPDGLFDNNDFIVFIDWYFAGC